MSAIPYPYLPTGRMIKYVDAHNPFMLEAREYARKNSLDDSVKTGSVIVKNGHETIGADLYLWGHWWACQPCWNAIIEAGIENVYLLKDSERLFNKASPDNIIGRQFD